MKILLVCGGGFSTSALMNKVRKYSDEHDLNVEIDAAGVGEYTSIYQNYDVILVAPQIRYKKDEVKSATQKPVEVIPFREYGNGNAKVVVELAEKTIKES